MTLAQAVLLGFVHRRVSSISASRCSRRSGSDGFACPRRLRRVVAGVSASPGCLSALRYAENLARRNDALLVAVHVWVPPSGDLAERRFPSPPCLRQVWKDAAHQWLREALDAAWRVGPAGLALRLMIIRGEPGPALISVASFTGDLLVVGSGGADG
jgi:nucleotide-binding universal stress UspA family protein